MKKKFDLSKINRDSHNFLTKVQPEDSDNNVEKKKSTKKKSEKLGRPMVEDEPLNYKITLNLTEKEILKLKDSSQQVPVSSFVRGILRKSGVI